MEEKVATSRKEVEEKIVAMMNKVAAVYYKDDDLIVMIEDKLKSKSHKILVTQAVGTREKSNPSLASNPEQSTTSKVGYVIHTDE